MQKNSKTTNMVIMEVRKKNRINLLGINPHFSHICQEDISLCSSIEKDYLRHSFDYTRESPGGFKLLSMTDVVKDDPDSQAR